MTFVRELPPTSGNFHAPHQSPGGGATLLTSARSDTLSRIPPGRTEPIHLTLHHRGVQNFKRRMKTARTMHIAVPQDYRRVAVSRNVL
jgi:hypothetical protein